MCATAAHLIEDVLPEVALRQWVLTFVRTALAARRRTYPNDHTLRVRSLA